MGATHPNPCGHLFPAVSASPIPGTRSEGLGNDKFAVTERRCLIPKHFLREVGCSFEGSQGVLWPHKGHIRLSLGVVLALM